MPRTIGGPELATLLSASRATHLRIEVQDSEAAWVDYSDYTGIDWQISASLAEDIDTPIVTGEIRLAREVDGDSLAPLMELSPLNEDSGGAYAPKLNAGRRVRMYEEITAPGTAPVGTNEHLVFDGYIDEVAWPDEDMVLKVSDLGSRLLKAFIETEEARGVAAGTAVETEMQALLDDWVTSPPTIVTPVSPGWNITEWTQAQTNVFEAVRALALQIGWEFRYRWGTGDTYEPTFYEPDRAKTTPDLTISPDDYFDVSDIKIGDSDIRNVVRVRFTDSATGLINFAQSEDAASIAANNARLFMEIEEDASSNIDTLAEAQAMADAAVADLATPFADHAIETPHLWHIQLGDLIRHEANAAHYDTDQDYAVVAIRREWRDGEGLMTLQTRGKPAGAYRRWLALGGGPTATPPRSGAPVLTIFEITSEGSADGGQPYGMQHVGLRWGRNCDEVRIHASRSATSNQGMPAMDNRHESATLTRPEGDIPQAEDWEMLWSIRTETNDWRMSTYLARNVETGQENIRQGAESRAVDSGTGPTGPPTGTMTVTPNGTTMEIRGLTAADASAEHLLYRNGINIARNSAGAGCDFDDPGLSTSGTYNYEVIAYRNGQTSSAPGAPPPQGGGGSSNASAPVWATGYPFGQGGGSSGPARVSFHWTGDAVYLTSVDVESSYWQSSNFAVWQTLLAAQPVNPVLGTVHDTSHPNGTDMYFRLKGNPVNPADPPLYSEVRYARYGTSTLP